MVGRAYTPVTLDRFDKGFFDLVVKRYPGGEFSEAFHRMKVGESMMFRGPVTTLRYAPNTVECLGMICGGTGITPMYQIIRTVLANPGDTTRLRLIYANRSEGDILLRGELSALAAEHPDRFQVRYLVEAGPVTGPTAPAEGSLSLGRVTAAIVQGFLPSPRDAPPCAVLVCGPEGMMRHLCGGTQTGSQSPPAQLEQDMGGLLGKLGYRNVVPFTDKT
jgi:NAD(P)H-flavin reductase